MTVDIRCYKCGKSVRETGSWLRLVKGTDNWECAQACDTKSTMTTEERVLAAVEDDD
jgi:DNA-directed RNA polymerase subunit N (RpoN/RPB10)